MKNLAVVTSVDPKYAPYLRTWAESIARSEEKPGRVIVYLHASTDQAERLAGEATTITAGAGIPSAWHATEERVDFGTARNRAVSFAHDAEWVMHLDADDMLMPHAIGDIRAIAETGTADVIPLGYERTGDLAAGPTNRKKAYPTSIGEQAVRNPTPASGPSPFRNSFWERSPYVTDQLGAWDTAFWIRLGWLGARFVPTKRPGFWYVQHADSVFNTRRANMSGWVTTVVSAQLASARRQHHGVAVLVPRAPDDGPEREAAWKVVRRALEAEHPNWSIVEGTIASGAPWSKGEAIRDALSKTDARTLVILDADCLIEPRALRESVAYVERCFGWAVPHELVHRLTEAATREITEAEGMTWHELDRHFARPAELDRHKPPYRGFVGGGCFVVSRPVYEACGGIPLAFRGWGMEDEAIGFILSTLLGPPKRGSSPLIHLWHPPNPAKSDRRQVERNQMQYRSLLEHRGKPDQLLALVGGGRGAYLPLTRTTSRPAREARQRENLVVDFARRAMTRQFERSRPVQPKHDDKMARPDETKSEPGFKLTRYDSWHTINEAKRYGLRDADFGFVTGRKITIGDVRKVQADRQLVDKPRGLQTGAVITDARKPTSAPVPPSSEPDPAA